MGASVKAIIAQNPEMRPGDVFVLNAPYNGGTHLPDITVVRPVWDEDGGRVLFFTAARGHHTDVGGLTPGSMPPDSRTIHDEGAYIDNWKLVEGGRFREAETRALLLGVKYPVRSPEINLADLRAQVAACEKGAQELGRMVGQFGLAVVEAYMRHVQDNAEECVRRAIEALSDGEYTYAMDPDFDGRAREIRVRITVDRAARSARIDFTGTTGELATNYNAPEPVTRAAVLYVFRCLVDDDIPMNEGVMKPLEVVLPEGTMLSPRYPAAVIAGNVETSQAVTSALFLALGVQAAAQSTMNNTTWGDDRLQYYETVCGGTGRRGAVGRVGLRRDGRGAFAHDELAADRPRGAGVALSGRRRRLPAARGLGRRRALARRRRRRAAHPLPVPHDGGDPRRAPGGAAARARRRGARRGRTDADRAGGRHGRGAEERRQARGGAGRCLLAGNARRRRLRRSA